MSAGYEERVRQWDAWHERNERECWEIVGYEHHCGAATLATFPGYDGSCCSGCHFELQYPNECTPLYRPSRTSVADAKDPVLLVGGLTAAVHNSIIFMSRLQNAATPDWYYELGWDRHKFAYRVLHGAPEDQEFPHV